MLDEIFNFSARYESYIAIPGIGAKHKLAWNVPEVELPGIPAHWLQYDEPEASIHYLLSIVYIGFFIMSIFGNGLVIWIFSTSKPLRNASNMFVVNLALLDFIMMLKAPIFIYNSFHRGYELGALGCQIFAGMGSVSGIGAGMTNACIAYDRYMTITRPLDGRMTRTKAALLIIIVWLYTVPWTALPATQTWGRFAPEGFLTSCTFDYLTTTFDNKLFVGSIFTFSYVLPMSMILYFYSHIVKQVFQHEKALREQAQKMNVASLRSNNTGSSTNVELRIAKTAIMICMLFVLSWTPYAVLALIGAFGDQRMLTPGITMIPALACKLVACVDPYVYAISHPRYRQELMKRLPWLSINEKSTDQDDQSVTTTTASTTPTA